jgi:hypothetical protein
MATAKAKMDDEEKALRKRILEARAKKAEMDLELTERRVRKHEETEHVRKIQNAQRQSNLRSIANGKANTALNCSHRQGATPKNRFKGKGPSALVVSNMPDGFTKYVMCTICPLRVYSPHPQDKDPKPRKNLQTGRMETAAEAKARVEQWKKDTREFKKLLAHSQDKLTEEASQEMECGVTMEVTNHEGLRVYKRRPSDFYVKGVAAEATEEDMELAEAAA